ncbi:cytosolic iron-sulfur protein assembly protein CIAO1 [Enteropsectra breve]|nr:cytosolic iron-sulfur protein assembly protein CIAO1 [Enteropsectra breve]
MLDVKHSKIDLKDRILAVYVQDNNLYAGLKENFVNLSTNQILHSFEKSVRTISGNGRYFGCCSYDGTGKILKRDAKSCKYDSYMAAEDYLAVREHLQGNGSVPSDETFDTLVDSIEGPDTEIKAIAFDPDNLIAIATRGRTVWVLEDFEISKILDDHTQDVKGCCFWKERLFSWSYDGTIKMYEFFDLDHSWELIQSIEIGEIVWSVVLLNDRLYASVQSGRIYSFEMKSGLWHEVKSVKLSMYPIFSLAVAGNLISAFAHRNYFVLLNENLEIEAEEGPINTDQDVFCSCYWEEKNAILCGDDAGALHIFEIKNE